MSEQEKNFYQPKRTAILTFSVNGSGVIFLWLGSPDLVMEIHPGDKYYGALRHWCQVRYRKEYVDVDLPIVDDDTVDW